MATDETKWVCRKCGVPLVTKKTLFNYMERNISEDLPCCPKCGKVFISPELCNGRMCEVEAMLEDK